MFPDEEKYSLHTEPGQKVFKFGGGEQLKSKLKIHLPCTLAGENVL